MNRTPVDLSPALVVLAGFLTALGCGAPRELAVVTERAPVVSSPSQEQSGNAEADTVVDRPARVKERHAEEIEPGRFDGGKMWTFDDPPTSYFQEEYDFEPGSQWFANARRSALRFASYCSASFVSPRGLVMTNHHCARQSVTAVSGPDEDLLDNGFYARSLDAERRVLDLYVDQLVSISDVTDEVYSAVREGMSDDDEVNARASRAESIAARMTSEASPDSTLIVEVVSLYHGGKYSAYTYRRYRDVRIVVAPELQIGFFGGDPDNFTYPRYNLDFAFFRVYEDDAPIETDDYFNWSADGAQAGEAVFVVGNPGSTSRLSTVAQLEFERDVTLPQQLRVLESRSDILESYIASNPEEAEKLDLRNVWFSLENSIKANRGQLDGLRSETLIPRKRAGEEELREAVAAVDSLQSEYGNLFGDIAKMQSAKRAVAGQTGAFTLFSSDAMTSHLLLRALHGYVHDLLRQRGAPQDRLDEMRKGGSEVSDWPAEVERGFIAARLTEMRDYLGADHPTVRSILQGGTPDSIAAVVVEQSALVDSTGFAEVLESGYLSSGDVSVDLIESIGSLYFSLGQQLAAFESREENLNAQLARAQFAVHGSSIPPDASFSLRIADGRVRDYAYNGTVAPVHTTFYGLYDRHHSFPDSSEWALPRRWTDPPSGLDLATPLNLVTTNDITGGNSGSPLLNTNLEVVGLVFDSNIEALPNEYLFRDESGRTISVDSRGIMESLDHAYDMDRVVLELRHGRMYESEEEADEQARL